MSTNDTKSRRVPRKLLSIVAIGAGAALAACGSDETVHGSIAVDASDADAGTTVNDASPDVSGVIVHDASPDVIVGTNVQDASIDAPDGDAKADG